MTKKVIAEIKIDSERIVSVTGEAKDIFALVNGLKKTQHNPEVRYQDEEIGGFTCWQPTSIPEKDAA